MMSRVLVGAAAAIAPGTWKVVEHAGAAVVVLNYQGAFYAFLDRCPHAAAPLSLGRLRGEELTCARHGWTFDVTTGAAIPDHPDFRLASVPVLVDGGDVYLLTA